MLAFGCGACTQTSQAPGPAVAAAGSGPTVSFESIDGPPESVFNRMVQTLSSEAQARQVAVVSRATPAQYRIKVYTATVVSKNRSVVSWVWDVYDADQRRAFRLTGEEPVSGAGSNTWAAADEQVIRRIASSGMERLVASMATPPSVPSTPARPGGPSVNPPAGTAVAVAAFDSSTAPK